MLAFPDQITTRPKNFAILLAVRNLGEPIILHQFLNTLIEVEIQYLEENFALDFGFLGELRKVRVVKIGPALAMMRAGAYDEALQISEVNGPAADLIEEPMMVSSDEEDESQEESSSSEDSSDSEEEDIGAHHAGFAERGCHWRHDGHELVWDPNSINHGNWAPESPQDSGLSESSSDTEQ